MASDGRDVEIEDGECLSDNDEVLLDSTFQSELVPRQESSKPGHVYRPGIPQIIINSEESGSDSDSNDCPPTWKRTYTANQSQADSNTPFVNPLLSMGRSASGAGFQASHRKKNSVWSSVLTEQVLSQEVKSFGVDKPLLTGNRDVETYDFTKAKEDERPDLTLDTGAIENSKDDPFDQVVDIEADSKKSESRKRKKPMKERWGKKWHNKPQKPVLNVTAKNDEAEVVFAITKGLHEPKMDLFSRIVKTIGKDLAIRLFLKTQEVEESGGMMTNDGFRRRTPGGVYIQLLKHEDSVTPAMIDSIFEQDQIEWKERLKEQRKMKKAARKRTRRMRIRREMDIDRPETPAPTDDLEVLNAADSNSEFETSDLPERPATPEPKDDSSDGQRGGEEGGGDNDYDDDEDEDGDEDISVVIAKAKAAILKKQRELVNGAASDGGVGVGNNGKICDDQSEEATSFECELAQPDILSLDVDIGEMDDV